MQLHTNYYGVCHGRIRSSSSMTHNHSLFRSLCTQRWTRACSLSPEAPSFWLAFQARPALGMHVFIKVQCSTLGSTLEDKCFSFFSTDWRWQWWRTSNSAVTAFIAKRPRVAYSCSYVLLLVCKDRSTRCCQPISSLPARPGPGRCTAHAAYLLYVRVRSCAGKAATRYGLGSRLTVAGRHFSIFSRSCQLLTRMIASSSSLSSARSIRVLVLELPTLTEAKDSLMFSWERSFFVVVMFVSGRLVNPVTSACASWMFFRDRLALCSCERLRDWVRRSASEHYVTSWVSKPCRPWKHFRLKGRSSCVKVCWMLGLDDAPTLWCLGSRRRASWNVPWEDQNKKEEKRARQREIFAGERTYKEKVRWLERVPSGAIVQTEELVDTLPILPFKFEVARKVTECK